MCMEFESAYKNCWDYMFIATYGGPEGWLKNPFYPASIDHFLAQYGARIPDDMRGPAMAELFGLFAKWHNKGIMVPMEKPT